MTDPLHLDIEAWRAWSRRDRVAAFAGARAALDADLYACVRHRFACEDHDLRRRGNAPAFHRSRPLEGVPCLVKANIAVQDELLDCASRILEGYVSPFSATVVHRLRAAGAWVLGSTNMDEFAMGSSSEHSVQGAVRHPFAPDRVAGGSSGGSAVAVAAGLVPFALGSDTGGSVRQPAGFCGVVGLQPTRGRVSRHGLVAFASSLDTVGILARTVADATRVLTVIEGADPHDATCARPTTPVDLESLERGVAGTTIGVVELDDDAGLADALDGGPDGTRGEPVAPDVRDDLQRGARVLAEQGARVVRLRLPSRALALAAYAVIADAEASTNLARYDGSLYGRRVEGEDYRTMVTRTRTEGFGPEVRQRILLGTWALTRGWGDRWYRRALGARARLRAHYAACFDQVDAILTPTSPTTAFPRGSRLDDPLRMRGSDRFTVDSNLAGLPAVAVPSGRDGEGLPLSLQVVGRPFDEATVLRVARALERAR